MENFTPEPAPPANGGRYNIMDKQAIIASLTPAVVFLVIALVAKVSDMELIETLSLFGGLLTLLGGGTVAWNKVYAKKSVDKIQAEADHYGRLQGAQQEAEARDEAEEQWADMWQETEQQAGLPPTGGFNESYLPTDNQF